ncbi:MAG: SDR family oxidoreductase [Myxococcota bacterium]|nr:SDR family oxidoreductase [Myxococcota bacterium]
MSGQHVLLTGGTGFVGKVVLYELIRRRQELNIERITLIVREGGRGSASARLRRLKRSRAFAGLPSGWASGVETVGGDLVEPRCGLADDAWERLTGAVTQIIHCAASIEFDLPIVEAAQANIGASLNVLELAQACAHLRRMVAVSTAYVSPHPGGEGRCVEELVALPRSAESLYAALQGGADQAELLSETGHPNTYTYTKCLSEHLISERRGSVPLTIVRPSIVSASWVYPTPGWIDSHAAFAGFVGLIGAGHLKAIVGDRQAALDVVPCDVVAAEVVAAAFAPAARSKQPSIRYAVAGPERTLGVGFAADVIAAWFARHPLGRPPKIAYLGPENRRFRVADWQRHKAPAQLVQMGLRMMGKKRQIRRVTGLLEKLDYLNEAFPYFTQHTYAFTAAKPWQRTGYSGSVYLERVCQGVYRYLMGRDEREMSFAGRKHHDPTMDVPWAVSKPYGNWAIRSAGVAVRAGLRRCASRVTFDLPSFERARAAVPPGALMVVVPNHRSYLDFLLCSFLFFDRPDLKIGIPYIAAASEFAELPGLGWLFKQTQAFYIRRGGGRADPALTQRIQSLAERGETLEFFIEGTRSRSRRFLAPKRGLLRALQSTGVTAAVLPVSISYDRLPEEGAFLKELRGAGKPSMGMRPLFRWLARATRGEVDLGRIHLRCGEPQVLSPATDVHVFARQVVGELQQNTVTTTYHLQSFLAAHPDLGLDLEYLRAELLRRGATILRSDLRDAPVDRETGRGMHYHFQHIFYPDLLRRWPDHAALRHHVEAHGFASTESAPAPAEQPDPRLERLLSTLFEPVCRDYQRVAQALGPRDGLLLAPTVQSLVRDSAQAHLPDLHAAFSALVERQIIAVDPDRQGGYSWGQAADQLEAFAAACAWPGESSAVA